MIDTRDLVPQLVRYGLVGGIVAGSDYAVYAATVWLSDGAYLAANGLGKVAGAGLGFWLHKRVTFSWKQRNDAGWQARAYAALFVFNLALSSVLLTVLVELGRFDAYLSRLAVDAVVIATAFVGSRLWVYRPA